MDFKKEQTLRRGPWLEEEDERLVKFVTLLGERRWDSLARVSGLKRSGKSCRLRWMNYLNPSLKRGPMSQEEEAIIFQLHAFWGNKWAKIARRLPGRTDNEVKNYYRTHFRKKMEARNYDKIIDWSGNTGEGLLRKYKKTEIMWTTTQEHSLDKTVKESKQINMESDKETYGSICEKESFGVMNSPYENRISDWISEISTDQSDENLLEDRTSSSSEHNINFNVASWWFQETRNFEEFSSSLWS
ncbi:Transcription factor MYB27 [Hirschfeldia incana]|nr:Transcription factor MYB27 [Hirschfeldia incana]